MHEISLLQSLVDQIIKLAKEHNAKVVNSVKLKVGVGVHIEPDHLREHFYQVANGSVAQNAKIDVEIDSDPLSKSAADIILQTIEIDDDEV
jgi:Zn finger protein HypA/HybF involved in hydrogenase expression